MDTLTQAALTAGSKIGFSAVEVADAEIELVKAGASVKDMMGGALVGALTLAAAGQIEVGKATEIATIAMTQFKLSGSDIPHVSDLLAAGADKALGGVQELGDGLKQGGLVASQFGLTIDDTVGTLSAFANAGLLGSDAGTSMKTMFLALASPSKQAQAALDQYNITAYDSEGKFKGVTELAGQLHDKLGGLSDAQRNAALSTIFGTDAMRSAAVLMTEGRDGIAKWISDVNDQGFAAQQAAGKMDNMNGDLKKLGAAFQTGLIEMGQSADGFLRPMIQGTTDAIHAFSGLPEPVKAFGISAATAVGGVALLAGGLVTMIPKALETARAFKTLITDAPRLAASLGTIGKVAGVAAAALLAFEVFNAVAYQKRVQSTEEITQSLLDLAKASDGAGIAALDRQLSDFGTFAGRKIAPDINSAADAITRITHPQDSDGINRWADQAFGWTGFAKSETTQVDESLSKVGDQLGTLVSSGSADAAAKAFGKLSDEFIKNGSSAQDALNHMPGYRDALLETANAAKVTLTPQELLDYALGKIPASMQAAAGATSSYTDAAGESIPVSKDQQKALDDVGLSADGVVGRLDKLVQSLESAGLLQLSDNDAARNYEASLDALTASIAKNGRTLDITTAKGRDNSAAFDGIAKAGLASAEAMAKNGSSQKEVQGNLTQTYNGLIKAANQFGITGDEADTMARKALGVPKGIDINAWLHDHASAAIDAIVGKANNANGTVVDIYAYTHDITLKKTIEDPGGMGSSVGGRANGSLRGGAATGGYIMGGGIGLRAFADGGHVGGFASAGYVQGPGSGTSDSILARLSNGEFVMRAAMVQKYGLGFMDSVNKGAFAPAQQPAAYAARSNPAHSYGGSSGGAGGVTVAAPAVTVMIGNEQLDSRMYRVAGAAISSADNNSQYMRTGRR
jgi:TP901 family phage tail tape measure protein